MHDDHRPGLEPGSIPPSANRQAGEMECDSQACQGRAINVNATLKHLREKDYAGEARLVSSPKMLPISLGSCVSTDSRPFRVEA